MSIIALTEKSNPKTTNIDLMETKQILQVINQEDQKIAKAVAKEIDSITQAVDLMVKSLSSGGKVGYFAAGTSGRLGVLDASEMPPTFGVSSELFQAFIAGGEQAVRHAVENAEDRADLADEDYKRFAPSAQDIVIVISASGNPQYVLRILEQAQKDGITAIGISSNPKAAIKKLCHVFICPRVGAEVITGSSRMKSGTAQKMILNMLSTATMIRLGKTYQNYMIDLNVNNVKLRDRACRIISGICNIDIREASEWLKKAKNNVKTACVMAHKKCSVKEAEKLLAQHQGILRKIIKDK